MIKSVKEIKKLISPYILPEYNFKTNFSCKDFLIEIGNGLIIKTEPIIEDDNVRYIFKLDTQFLSSKEITFEEIIMVKNIIDVLEDNRKFVLAKFKKYTKEELLEEQRIKEENSKKMLEALKKAFFLMHQDNEDNDL